MTDFLTNLVTRSVSGQPMAAVLQPRLPSLFEPQRGMEANQLAAPDEILHETLSPVQKPSTLPNVANEPASGMNVTKPPIFVNQMSIEEKVDSPLDPDLQRRTVVPASILEEPQRTILPRPEDAPAIRKHSAQEHVSLTSENSLPSRGTKSQLFDEVARKPIPALKGLVEEETVFEKIVPIPANDLSQQNEMKTVVLQPLVPPTHFRDERRLGQTPAREPERVIEIHIGHIEVRAVPPATLGKRTPQPVAKTSLEDYLHARSKGKR